MGCTSSKKDDVNDNRDSAPGSFKLELGNTDSSKPVEAEDASNEKTPAAVLALESNSPEEEPIMQDRPVTDVEATENHGQSAPADPLSANIEAQNSAPTVSETQTPPPTEGHDLGVISSILNEAPEEKRSNSHSSLTSSSSSSSSDEEEDDVDVPPPPPEPTHSIVPHIGFVLKTKRDRDQSKVFVNIFYHEEKELHNFVLSAPAKRSVDKKGVECEAYDVSIPKSYFMKCSTSEEARKEVCIDSIYLVNDRYAEDLSLTYTLPNIKKGFVGGEVVTPIEVPESMYKQATTQEHP